MELELELLPFLKVNSKNAVKLACQTHKTPFYLVHSSVFGEVREFVGEIKYAFDMMINFCVCVFT